MVCDRKIYVSTYAGKGFCPFPLQLLDLSDRRNRRTRHLPFRCSSKRAPTNPPKEIITDPTRSTNHSQVRLLDRGRPLSL